MRAPVVPSQGVLRPLSVDQVRITDGFWTRRDPSVIIEHCREWMERLGWIDNFRLFHNQGRLFADSEIYKLLEAMAWAGHPGVPELAATVAAAQEPDGYLHTKFGRPGLPPRYSDLEWGHELYCYGHLIQAGVARLRSGVQDELATTAIAAADHVCAEFGPKGRGAYCGHPEVEMALVELYRATGRDRYLEQAKLFVDRRGQGRLREIEFGPAYFQDDVPVRQRRAFSGHAVREVYLACGAVDVAVETGDGELLGAIIGQWERTVAARTYLTGGMGSRHEGESFGHDYELPPDGAYSETCAGIGSVMLAWRLLLATGEVRFADLIERTLFNVVATSPAPDGRSFFYANPLQQRTLPVPLKLSSRAVTGQRAPWFEVSCCPTNIARISASLAGYLATSNEDGVQVHQYAPARIATGEVTLDVETAYPWDGVVKVRMAATLRRPWTLTMRVPAWAAGATLDGHPVNPGYHSVSRQWREGDEVILDLPMPPRWTTPDPRIDAVRGCVALERGPLVYCAESPDSLDLISVDPSAPVTGDAQGLTVSAFAHSAPAAPWPYGVEVSPEGTAMPLTLVPYHLWANDGPSTMRVWLPLTTGTPA